MQGAVLSAPFSWEAAAPQPPPRNTKNPPHIHGKRMSDRLSIGRPITSVIYSTLPWVEEEFHTVHTQPKFPYRHHIKIL